MQYVPQPEKKIIAIDGRDPKRQASDTFDIVCVRLSEIIWKDISLPVDILCGDNRHGDFSDRGEVGRDEYRSNRSDGC